MVIYYCASLYVSLSIPIGSPPVEPPYRCGETNYYKAIFVRSCNLAEYTKENGPIVATDKIAVTVICERDDMRARRSAVRRPITMGR